MRCKACGEDVKFVAEAFGALCSSCGVLQEEDDYLVPSIGQSVFDEHSKQNRYREKGSKTITGSRIASFHRSRLDERQNPLEKWIKKRETQRFITGILTALHRPSLGGEVQMILRQAQIAISLSNDEMEQRIDLLDPKRLHTTICAACFIVVHKRSPQFTLLNVCQIVDQDLNQAKTALNDLEKLLAKVVNPEVERFGPSYDTPATYFDVQIDFLLRHSRLAVQRGLILNKNDVALLRRADIGSTSFRQLADQLSEMCAENGLFNRSGKKGSLIDLGICSWAILMLTIETRANEVCSENRFSELATWAPGWQVGKKLNGFTKSQLGLEDGHEEEEKILEDQDRREEALRSAIKTVSTLVHFKYHDICSLASVYTRCLPWFDKNDVPLKKCKGNRKPAMQTTDENRFPEPLPRKTIIFHLQEIIKLRKMLDKKVREIWQNEVFNSNDDVENVPYGFLYDALLTLSSSSPQSDQRSKLANSIGTALLTAQALEEMDDQVADGLLFREGELRSYIYSAEERAAKTKASEL